MDFLLEALTNWLKEMLVGGIMSNLSGMTVWTIMIMARTIPRNGKPRMRSRTSLTLMGAAQKMMTRTA